MTNRNSLLAFTALATLSGGMAHAIDLPAGQEVNRQAIETAFAAYEYIDIRFGPTQVKVEAVDAETGEKIEAIYLKATGEKLKTEAEPAGDDAGRSGIFVRSLSSDFVDDDTSDTTSDDDGSDLSEADDDTSDSSVGDDDASDSSAGDDDASDSSAGDDDNSGSDDDGSDGGSDDGDSGDDNSGEED